MATRFVSLGIFAAATAFSEVVALDIGSISDVFCVLMIWVVIPIFSVMFLADMLLQLQFWNFLVMTICVSKYVTM